MLPVLQQEIHRNFAAQLFRGSAMRIDRHAVADGGGRRAADVIWLMMGQQNCGQRWPLVLVRVQQGKQPVLFLAPRRAPADGDDSFSPRRIDVRLESLEGWEVPGLRGSGRRCAHF